MEANMKKYSIIMFSILVSMLMVLPLTMQAGEVKDCDMIKSQDGKHMMSKPGGMKGHHDRLSSLDLDEEVLLKIKESKLKYKEKILELKGELEKKKLEMEKVLIGKELDLKKLLSIHDEMANLKQKISRKRIEQKIEMYKLLPDDKKERAKEMFLHKFLKKGHGKSRMHKKHGDTDCPMKK
jgi:Spy/CpxP family protein refolding chaperone